MRRIAVFLVVVLVARQACLAAELSAADTAEAEARQSQTIEAIESQISEIDARRLAALKTSDRAASKQAIADLKSKRIELIKAKRKTLSEYNADAEEERAAEAREQELRREARREAAAKADAELAVQMAERQDEENRQARSGGCPLRLTGANFAHLLDDMTVALFNKGVGPNVRADGAPATMLACHVVSTTDQDIVAWEFQYQFIDGFETVVHQGTFKNPTLGPKEKKSTVIAVQHAPDAVQMQIYLQRAKLADGTVWERKPEHRGAGVLVKRMDGANIKPYDQR